MSQLFPRPQFLWGMTPRPKIHTGMHALEVWVREDLIDLGGVAAADEVDLEALIWHGIPSSLNAPPFETATSVSTDGVGHCAFQISATGLALFDPITILFVKPGSPNRFGVRTIIPSYE